MKISLKHLKNFLKFLFLKNLQNLLFFTTLSFIHKSLSPNNQILLKPCFLERAMINPLPKTHFFEKPFKA